jgi:electron transfer flavoprotein alpha subunit
VSDVCIVAAALDGALSRSALELVAAARELAPDQIAAALLGHGEELADAARTLQRHGVGVVYRVDHALLASGQTDAALVAVRAVVERDGSSIVLVSADTVGRELAPRLAHRMGAALATECVEVGLDGGRPVVKRQVYGGRAVATIAIKRRPAVISIKPRALEPAAEAPASGPVVDVEVDLDPAPLGMQVVDVQREHAERGLDDAQIVVGGGRGLGGPEGFAVLQQLADVMGAAVGSSRPPADAGWVPINWQIGQTGKTIRPALYIAVGISGATQHIAGVAGARTIVAINRDAEAPIFALAHLGVVGDYKEIVPLLVAKVKELKGL